MKLAKSIDELYEEVKGYDLVLCNDAPLALALNNRLDCPRIGPFAMTPREIAGDVSLSELKCGVMSDIELVRAVADITKYKIRYVHGEIENFKTIRRYTADVRKHLGRKARNVYDEYVEFPTLDRVMERFDGETSELFEGKKIAVVGGELYDSLDKHFNPKFGTYEEINLFKRGSYSIPEIRELSNDRQMAENAVSLIDKDNATDVAIVMDVGGKIADAVRSALYRKKIPFINSLNVKDLNHIRDFLEFLTLSLSFETAKVGQVRELISAYGGFIRSKYDGYLVEQYAKLCEHEKTVELLGTMRDIKQYTYLEICEKVVNRKDAAQVKVLLNEMKLNDALVNEKDTGDMTYAVNNIGQLKHNEQIPENEKEGVLLVDCKKSVYIDRPIVIYMGIGTEWDKDLSDLNQIDYRLKDDINEMNVEKFQILLQQGTARIYICNSTKGGRKPKPCSFFDQCSNGITAKTFSDVCGNVVAGPWYRPPVVEKKTAGAVVFDIPYIQKPFSKTSYDSFVSCPRGFQYGLLLGSSDHSSTIVGTYLHEYAEFRICYPELAKKHDVDYYADIISNDCTGLYVPELRTMERSGIRNSICNIDRFVETMGFCDKVVLGTKKNDDKPNRFFLLEGVEDGSQMTEARHVSRDSHMEGTFDVIEGDHIYDFKTGAPNDASEILKSMNLDKISDFGKEFQCMFYLSLLDEMSPGGKKTFSHFYTTDNDAKSAHGMDFDIRENMRHVVLIESKEEYFEKEFFDYLVTKIKKYAPLENCRDIIIRGVLSIGLDHPERILTDTSIIAEVTTVLKNTKTNRELVEGALKKISEEFSGAEMYARNEKNTLFVTRNALATFRKDVWSNFVKIGDYYKNEFPAIPKRKCIKCDFHDLCTAEPLVGGDEDVETE